MEIYSPAEDSYLLAEALKEFLKNKIKILDLGTGSGIQSKNCIENGIKKENITAADINKEALENAKKLKIKVIYSNLFSKIKGKFDLIIFNPPYLPEDKYDIQPDTTGGKYGSEIINEFLKQASFHLTKSGKIFLLTSSLTKRINWLNYKKKKVAEEKLFFETLWVWKLHI